MYNDDIGVTHGRRGVWGWVAGISEVKLNVSMIK